MIISDGDKMAPIIRLAIIIVGLIHQCLIIKREGIKEGANHNKVIIIPIHTIKPVNFIK